MIPSFAGDDTVQELKQQIKQLQQKVDKLEAQNQQAKPSTGKSAPTLRRRSAVWDPFEEMARMQAEMNNLFQDSFLWGGPAGKGMFRSNVSYDEAFNIKEDPTKYVVEFDMTGLDKGKVDIEINKNTLTVKAEESQDQTNKDNDTYFKSRSYTSFMRSIPVPANADTTKMQSKMKGDKLIITLPKKVS